MPDNFNFKNFLFENKLGAYSKATLLNEEDYDTKRDLIGVLGSNPTVDDVSKHLNISYDEAESLMKRLGMGLYKPSSAPGGGFRSNYAAQDAQARRDKAQGGTGGVKAGALLAQATMNVIQKSMAFSKPYIPLEKLMMSAKGDLNAFTKIVNRYAEKAGADLSEKQSKIKEYWEAYQKRKKYS